VDESGTNIASSEPAGKGPPAPALGGAEEQHLLMECVTDYAIFFLDLQGRVAAWNAGAERILGYRESEAVGQPFRRFFTPEDIQSSQPEKELQTAARTGRANDDRWLVRRDGNRLWCSGVTTALRDEEGRLRGSAAQPGHVEIQQGDVGEELASRPKCRQAVVDDPDLVPP
jgi:PAS domain S-box-containing protein